MGLPVGNPSVLWDERVTGESTTKIIWFGFISWSTNSTYKYKSCYFITLFSIMLIMINIMIHNVHHDQHLWWDICHASIKGRPYYRAESRVGGTSLSSQTSRLGRVCSESDRLGIWSFLGIWSSLGIRSHWDHLVVDRPAGSSLLRIRSSGNLIWDLEADTPAQWSLLRMWSSLGIWSFRLRNMHIAHLT